MAEDVSTLGWLTECNSPHLVGILWSMEVEVSTLIAGNKQYLHGCSSYPSSCTLTRCYIVYRSADNQMRGAARNHAAQ